MTDDEAVKVAVGLMDIEAEVAHGLPLIGRADWNDCLNLNCFSDTPGQSFQTTTNKDGKVAESVFIAGLFVYAGRELAAIAKHRGQDAEASRYIGETEKNLAVIAEHGWDGEWFHDCI